MTFTVKYRSNNGSIAEKPIEAANRADCFANCKAQGIVPISVEYGSAGRNESKMRNVDHSLKRFFSGGKFLCCVAVLSVAGIFIWFRQDREIIPSVERGKKKIRVIDIKPVAKTNLTKVVKKPMDISTAMQSLKRVVLGSEVVASSARTNQSGAVIEKLRLADGRTIEKVTPPKPIFDNPSDQMIAVALSANPGQTVAPFPDLGSIDDDFAKSLATPIRIEEGDSEETKELKLKVKEARAYIAAEIGQGKTAKQCLYEYREEMERIADSHLMAITQMETMKKEGASAAEISKFRTRINEFLREKGITELPEVKKNNTEEKQ